ncbi:MULTISPECIES: type II secretion system protein [unclassified Dolichospermum]|uniref:type II secretion system protein n=1 Tax=unclassified Dolichospermum TaxID=2622029 RepID=UPI00144692F3|nr:MULTISPECIES: type II secretion system protein [unclassified Dolichospermum]MTJ17707.1 type II secretion system protein [Dolichospermum sp. UHCC 0299]MTJ37469.1 type II secretion system protein [Dolichospermum sp. UHCC 0406]
MNYLQNNRSNSGFTLIETITALLMIGILSAIAAPSWFALIKTQHLNIAQDQVYRAMREAQSQAKKEKLTYHASFREENNNVQWAVHPATIDPSNAKWNDLDPSVQLDVVESTLQLSNGVRRVRFDDIGGVIPPLGKITLSSKPGGTAKRCVIVSTILGAMRTAKDNSCN